MVIIRQLLSLDRVLAEHALKTVPGDVPNLVRMEGHDHFDGCVRDVVELGCDCFFLSLETLKLCEFRAHLVEPVKVVGGVVKKLDECVVVGEKLSELSFLVLYG
jgi:hypothetical protein